MRNQRHSYVQEAPNNRFNGQNNYTHSYAEQDEPETENFRHDAYRHNGSTTYPSTSRTHAVNDGDVIYVQNAQFPIQQRQNYPGSQSQQEQYFHRADVNHYTTQLEADVLDEEEIEDEEELHMGYGDWEEDNNQTVVYRRSNSSQTRRLTDTQTDRV